MFDAHLRSLAGDWSVSASLYAQSLEAHKGALSFSSAEPADLRLALAHFHSGKAANALGRGRAGRASLERAGELAVAALGGEAHGGLAAFLEPLADTAAALGQHEAAMAAYRRLLHAAVALRGEAHEQAQRWRDRVLQLYQTMQAAQEEQRRRQAQAQQEQLRRVQEQRQREADDRQKKAAAAKAAKDKAKPKDDL